MKLKRIESVCKNGASIRIDRGNDGRLWIGDSAAVYFVGGLKDISKEQLLYVFDIPEEKWELYDVRESAVGYDDNDDIEKLIDRRLATELCAGGKRLVLYEADGKLICVNGKYLKPIDDEKDCTLFLRNGGKVVAVKRGMFLIALISVFDIRSVEEIKNDVKYISESL